MRPTTTVIQLGYPLRVDDRGRYVGASDVQHVEQMMLQVLLTAPGERVNRPDFGCGLTQRVFEPDNATLAASLRFDVTHALQRWLGDVIDVVGVNVTPNSEVLSIDVIFSIRADPQVRMLQVRA
jgi:uncharacterized protein